MERIDILDQLVNTYDTKPESESQELFVEYMLQLEAKSKYESNYLKATGKTNR